MVYNTNEDIPPKSPSKAATLGNNLLSPEQLPLVHRQRRLTDSKEVTFQQLGPTIFDVRKATHKKKFAKDIPERKKITMLYI